MRESKHGGTERDHEEALIKMGAIQPRKTPEIPYDVAYIFEAYSEAKFSRIPTSDGFALYPRSQLTNTELAAFNENSGLQLQPWEISAMLDIDAIFERSLG